MLSFFGGLFAQIGTAVSTGVENVLKFFRDLPGRAVDALSSLGGRLVSAVTGALGSMKDTAARLIGDVVSAIGSLPSKLGDLAGAMFNAGKRMIGGLFDGLKAIGGGAADIAKSIANGVINFINSAIDSLNDFLEFDFKIKGVGFHVDPPDLPHIPTFAKGGIFDQATAGIFGEAGREVLVPLTDPARAEQLARESGLLDLLIARTGGLTGNRQAAPAHFTPAGNVTNHYRTVTVNAPVTLAPAGDAATHAAQLSARLAAWAER